MVWVGTLEPTQWSQSSGANPVGPTRRAANGERKKLSKGLGNLDSQGNESERAVPSGRLRGSRLRARDPNPGSRALAAGPVDLDR